MNIYIVYKTTNLVNNKYYIGKHKQPTFEFDGYLGSGSIIKRAIEKYGKRSFIRETLAVFECEQECYNAEKQILAECWQDENCYNLESGGRGGKTVSKESRKRMSEAALKRGAHGPHTEETKRKISKNHNSPGMSGKTQSEETKRKMREKSLGRKHTEESKSIMSAAKKGKAPWNKGIKLKEKHPQGLLP